MRKAYFYGVGVRRGDYNYIIKRVGQGPAAMRSHNPALYKPDMMEEVGEACELVGEQMATLVGNGVCIHLPKATDELVPC